MTAWPDYAEIGGDYTARFAPAEERAAFDDGAARQARAATRPVLLREIAAWVPAARLGDFRAWARGHARSWFAFADPGADGAIHTARVVGGAHGIAWRQVARAAGAPVWEGRMTLEGPVADTSVWDAELGDASHVYARSTGNARLPASPGRPANYRLFDSRRGGPWPLPAALTDTPAWVVFGAIRGAPEWVIDLNLAHEPRPDPWRFGLGVGPTLTPAARRGLALCFRAGAAAVAVTPVGGGVDRPADATEPYRWPPAGAAWVAFRDAIAALRRSPDAALVWAGAGSVVDLARQTTRLGGSPPAP